MSTVIVIPARYASSRFPGKPLADIKGRSLVHRAWALSKAVKGVDEVYVATDDERIAAHVDAFGGKAVMTPVECRNGTERVWAAIQGMAVVADTVINFQGDAIVTPPWILQDLVDTMQCDPAPAMATPAVQLNWTQYESLRDAKAAGQTTGTLVTFNRNHNALYFSKGMIPFIRERDESQLPPVYQHIGIYAYQTETLKRYLALEPTPLEKVESLEQLRALENGIDIRVIEADYRGRTQWSVDRPEDVKTVEEIIAREGELLEELQ